MGRKETLWTAFGWILALAGGTLAGRLVSLGEASPTFETEALIAVALIIVGAVAIVVGMGE